MSFQEIKYQKIPLDNITLYQHPIIYLSLIGYLILDIFRWIHKILFSHSLLILLIITIWGMLMWIPFLSTIYKFIFFALYWILLGVASSIGLGTGLHTFVLYLGPHIAKLTLIASNCGYVPNMIPSRWEFNHFQQCQSEKTYISFFTLLLAVQLQAFFWGFGTALGQLPPYFIARKASQTRAELKKLKQSPKKDQESKPLLNNHEESAQVRQIMQLKASPNKTIIDKIKIIIYDKMQKYGFITILACASIPNPLFDLAGITCGHFQIPFRTFFTATFIGKAIIKVHIQVIFVIIMFHKQSLKFFLKIVGWFSKTLSQTILDIIELQKKQLHQPNIGDGNKSIISKLWDLLLIAMISYFIWSIINGQVKEKAIQKKDK